MCERLLIMFNVLWEWSLWILLYGVITVVVLVIIGYIGLRIYKSENEVINNIKLEKIKINKKVA